MKGNPGGFKILVAVKFYQKLEHEEAAAALLKVHATISDQCFGFFI